MNKKTNSYIYIFILLIFSFHLVNNIVILKQHTVPLFFDEGGFYNLSVLYYRHLFSSWNIAKIFKHLYSISTFYPPLVFIAKIPFFAILGESQDASILANSFFLFLLIYFTFLIGKHLAGEKVGLLSAFLVSFYPGIYGFSRTNFVTIPMAASVIMSQYLLLRSDVFRSRKYSILLGFSVAFGLLIKWLYIIYLLPGALIYCFAIVFRGTEKFYKTQVKNLLIALILGLLVALPWYLPNIKNILPMMSDASYDNPNWFFYLDQLKLNPFRLNLFMYIFIMEKYHLFTFYLLIFAYFMAEFITKKKNSIEKIILLGSIFLPYIIFNFSVIDYYSGELCPRYIIPLFPLVAFISAEGIMNIRKRIVRKSMIVSVILVGIMQFYWVWVVYGKNEKSNIFDKETFQRYTTRGLLSPKQVDWKLEEIVNTIRDNRLSSKLELLIIPHTPLTSALTYYLQLHSPSNVIFPLNATFIGNAYASVPKSKYEESIKKSEFILTQEGEPLSYSEDSEWVRDSIEALVTAFEEQKYRFSLLKEVDIYDGRLKILIYRRNIQADDAKDLSESHDEGTLIHAVDFSEGNLVYNSEFGLLIDGGISPAYATYEITLPYDGKYELWAKYATRDFRPVEIYFDGTLRKSTALTKFTQGWTYSDSRWFKELDIDAEKGKHTLKLVAQKTPFPHIDSIKMVYKTK